MKSYTDAAPPPPLLLYYLVSLTGTMLLYRQPARNPEEDNSVAEVYFQCGPDNLAERAALDMLAQVHCAPFFACPVLMVLCNLRLPELCQPYAVQNTEY